MRKEAPTSGAVTAARLDSVSEGESAASGRKLSAVTKETGTSVPHKPSVGGTTTITTAIISSSSSSSASSSGASSMPSVPGGGAYGYHHDDDESSAFEKSMDSLENMNPLQYEVLETTV